VIPLQDLAFPDRVAELRRQRGLSQRELGAAIRRSESWVSQVERGVQPVERFAVLQTLADALGVAARVLRPDAGALVEPEPVENKGRTEVDELQLALAGHPALASILSDGDNSTPPDIGHLRQQVSEAWQLTHSSQFAALSHHLSLLLPQLETAARTTKSHNRRVIHELLASAYQAAAATFVAVDEPAAAWIAADRAIRAAEDAGHPLQVVAGLFRLAHTFIRLDRLDLAERVATTAIDALQDRTGLADCPPEELSLLGAMHLVLAVISSRENDRTKTREHIATARQIAGRLGIDRNDLDTEFGPTNVELHAVSVAADLGDAGEALERAAGLDASGLSPERQARFHLDLARAHAQRRHVGDAVAALLTAEGLSPEQIRTHELTRATIRDLLGISGRKPTEELHELAKRCGATP
jgi:transcriptional regulator with XRE-family HTH domain